MWHTRGTQWHDRVTLRFHIVPLLKRNSVPAVTAWPWQFVRRTWDRPLEQCSGALPTANALHTACVSGGVLVNVLATRFHIVPLAQT